MDDPMLSVKNWDRFQHYKDRNPPWIKLHQDLLSSHHWVMGTDEHRLLMVAIMLLAARLDNKIPASPDYIKRVSHLDHEPDIQWLIEVGFCCVASATQKDEEKWPSRYISQTDRNTVLSRDNNQCVICGSSDNLEIDHIHPVSKGGKSEVVNLQTLCRSCNRRKRVSVASATQKDLLRRIETEERRGETEENPCAGALEEEAAASPSPRKQKIDFQPILDLWRSRCVPLGLPDVLTVEGRRKSRLEACAKNRDWMARLSESIDALLSNPFNLGENDRRWKADIDYLIRPGQAAKLVEAHRARNGKAAPPTPSKPRPPVIIHHQEPFEVKPWSERQT